MTELRLQAVVEPDDSRVRDLLRQIAQLKSELHDTKLQLQEYARREKEFDFTERTLREQINQLTLSLSSRHDASNA